MTRSTCKFSGVQPGFKSAEKDMALTSTLYDFQIALANTDRGVDQQLSFKVARHPSETMQRVWLRVLAYCWLWEERLQFGPGLSTPDSPDLETRDYTGLVTAWVRVGHPEPLKVQRAIDQNGNAQVWVLFEDPVKMKAFLSEAVSEKMNRISKAKLAAVEPEFLQSLAANESRRTKANVTLAGDHFYLDLNGVTVDGPLTHG